MDKLNIFLNALRLKHLEQLKKLTCHCH